MGANSPNDVLRHHILVTISNYFRWGPAAIVIGSEGSGMTRLVSENCDFLVSIPMKGRISSLNASAAAAILLYEAVRQRS